MRRMLGKSVVVGIVVLLTSALGVQRADAAALISATLTGIVSPDPVLVFAADPAGVATTGFGITMRMTGTGALVAPGSPLTCPAEVEIAGVSRFLTGAGAGTLDCEVQCNFAYSQVGAVMTLSGSCPVHPPGTVGVVNGACVIATVTTAVAAKCEFRIG